jgi:myosin-5
MKSSGSLKSLANGKGKPKQSKPAYTGAPVSYVPGTQIWVADDEEAWIIGEVERVEGDTISVKTHNGVIKGLLAQDCPPVETLDTMNGVQDMTTLNYLHEPGVLDNLGLRYNLDRIYTLTGSILIAVNPFRRLPHLYDQSVMERYKGVQLGELPPHAFAVADAAYQAMINDRRSQSILVSGESGAGKTETTKHIMR